MKLPKISQRYYWEIAYFVLGCIIGIAWIIFWLKTGSSDVQLLAFCAGVLATYFIFGQDEKRIKELVKYQATMKTNYDREIAIYLDTINELSTALDNKEKENQTKAATTAIMLSFNIKLIGEKDDKLEQLRNKLMEIEFILIEAGGELLLEHISLLGQCCMGYIPANKIGSISSKLSQFNFDVEIIESHQWVN